VRWILVLSLLLGADPALARLAESPGCEADGIAVQGEELPRDRCPPAPHDCGDACACACCCAQQLAAQGVSVTRPAPPAVPARGGYASSLLASDDRARPFRPPIS
jgi:hypothetical protein